MYPLLHERQTSGPLLYVVLDDALASGGLEVTEVSEQGRVPELRVVNRGVNPVLLVDGEELVGAKQNRVVNLTILVAPHSQLTIPVSCVEAGRWRSQSRAFSSAARSQYTTGRAKRMAQVSQSMAFGPYASDQSEVWADIAEKSSRLKAHSPTGAMAAMFADNAAFIDECVASLTAAEGQVGAMFAIDGRALGFDLFESPAILRKLVPKLVRASAVDALDETPGQRASGMSPDVFVRYTKEAAFQETAAIGIGTDLRLTAPVLTGAALVADDRLVHLSAFARA